MVRYHLEPKFREKLFKKAAEREGGETYLGRKLGYSMNFGTHVRLLRKGEVSIDEKQLRILSSITHINWNEIQKHIVKVSYKNTSRFLP